MAQVEKVEKEVKNFAEKVQISCANAREAGDVAAVASPQLEAAAFTASEVLLKEAQVSGFNAVAHELAHVVQQGDKRHVRQIQAGLSHLESIPEGGRVLPMLAARARGEGSGVQNSNNEPNADISPYRVSYGGGASRYAQQSGASPYRQVDPDDPNLYRQQAGASAYRGAAPGGAGRYRQQSGASPYRVTDTDDANRYQELSGASPYRVTEAGSGGLYREQSGASPYRVTDAGGGFYGEQMSGMAEFEMSMQVAREAMAASQQHDHTMIAPLQQAAAAGVFMPLHGGALPSVLIVKMFVQKLKSAQSAGGAIARVPSPPNSRNGK